MYLRSSVELTLHRPKQPSTVFPNADAKVSSAPKDEWTLGVLLLAIVNTDHYSFAVDLAEDIAAENGHRSAFYQEILRLDPGRDLVSEVPIPCSWPQAQPCRGSAHKRNCKIIFLQ
jgi:hypothetical protein